ncbi:sigma 54-interacting transcriptional regulator [Lysinibacillus sp. LZ02]|uniref:sigma 54-interacting transcriptional regulator n=1 Tax=Lysinibacillus sp. LZ02 TaxID=3420668 RepID=UPI003D362238
MIIKDYANTDYIQLTPMNTVRDALAAFLEKKQDVGCIEENGNLLGIVTKSILYRAILKDSTLSHTMQHIMKKNIVTLQAEESMFEAKDTLLSKQVGHAVVLNNKQQVYGVLTTPNLINGFLTAYRNISNHMHTLIENLHDAMISVDVTLQITGYNQAAIAMYPQLQNDYMNAPIASIDLALATSLQQAIQQRSIVDSVVLHIKNKKFIASFIPLFELNQLTGAMVMLRDITAFESIATELASTKKLERMLDSAVELSFDAVLIVDTNNRIIRANEGFLTLYDVDNEKISHSALQDVAPEIAPLLLKQSSTELIQINDVMCLVSCKEMRDEEHYGTLITIMFQQLSVWKNVLDNLETLEHNIPFVRATFEELDSPTNPFSQVVSKSTQMRQVKKEALVASNSHLPIFITGENGTGKSLLAKCIHEASKRTGHFIAVNCAAIPQELMESEFFGYVDGAFTGAKRGGKPGKFELADKGTLFLDEIGDMPLALQAKLLRVLQEHEIERLGDTKPRKVNVRIITATNKNLQELVEKKLFREDLYYRIHVIHLHMPSLQGRQEDIILLSERFLHHIIEREQKAIVGFTPEAMQALTQYTWPGNVRQLENAIERASHFCDGRFIQVHHLPSEIQPVTTVTNINLTRKERHADLERLLILETLQQCNGNKTEAARKLGISRTALYNKLKQFHIDEQILYSTVHSK